VKAATGAPGMMLAQLNGRQAGQSVFHIHMHIIPRHHGIELEFHERNMVPPPNWNRSPRRFRAPFKCAESGLAMMRQSASVGYAPGKLGASERRTQAASDRHSLLPQRTTSPWPERRSTLMRARARA